MKFIKTTGHGGVFRSFNVDHIAGVFSVSDNQLLSEIHTSLGVNDSYLVKGSPEEIMALIEGSSE